MTNEKKITIAEYKLNKLMILLGQSSNDLVHFSDEVRNMEKMLSSDPLYCVISTNLFAIQEEIAKAYHDVAELKNIMEIE